jgi:Rieske Fe-S protein
LDNKFNNLENKIPRRGFLHSIYRWILALFILPAGYAVYKLFERPKFIPHSKRNVHYDSNKYRKELPLQNLPENSSLYTEIDDEKILIIRKNGNDILAYSAVCTHKNCTVNFRRDMKDIFCDCHESSFNLDGVPINGPATEPLPKYKAGIENGKIIVTFS